MTQVHPKSFKVRGHKVYTILLIFKSNHIIYLNLSGDPIFCFRVCAKGNQKAVLIHCIFWVNSCTAHWIKLSAANSLARSEYLHCWSPPEDSEYRMRHKTIICSVLNCHRFIFLLFSFQWSTRCSWKCINPHDTFVSVFLVCNIRSSYFCQSFKFCGAVCQWLWFSRAILQS